MEVVSKKHIFLVKSKLHSREFLFNKRRETKVSCIPNTYLAVTIFLKEGSQLKPTILYASSPSAASLQPHISLWLEYPIFVKNLIS